MVAGEAEGTDQAKVTRMARLVSFLVRMRFLAVTRPEGRPVGFSLCSRRGLACLFIYYIFSILLNLLYLLTMHFAIKSSNQLNTAMEAMDPTDLLSSLSYNLCTFLTLPALPLLLSRAAARAPMVALSPSLPWPSTAAHLAACELLAATSYALIMAPGAILATTTVFYILKYLFAFGAILVSLLWKMSKSVHFR